MRWILIAFLICNGVYFLWQNYLQHNGVPAPEAATRTHYQHDNKLTLLAEVASDELLSTEKTLGAKLPQEPINIESDENQLQSALVVQGQVKPAMCWLIGPFKEQVSGKQVVNRLSALGISVNLESIVIPGAPDYWVHLAPQISRRVALKLLRELQAKKIDSFLITDGELANGISLGFFTQKARADKVYEQRIAQGYDAKIKIVPRAHTELWAVFAVSSNNKFSDVLWEKIQQGNKGLERRKNFCDKIASQDNFD